MPMLSLLRRLVSVDLCIDGCLMGVADGDVKDIRHSFPFLLPRDEPVFDKQHEVAQLQDFSLTSLPPLPEGKVKPTREPDDDRLSNRYDAVEEDDNARPVILDLSDLHEEQHSNVENLQEVVEVAEVAEAEAKPRIRRLSLTTLIIDLAVLVVRKLALKAR
ncbi:hypothetical protein EV424DRAFT_1343277 [Suillus variegatus]|nr:hypothetical protein EV424DRAFT_1343277 [Suillus variegatus]